MKNAFSLIAVVGLLVFFTNCSDDEPTNVSPTVSDQTYTIAEDTPVETLIGSMDATDADEDLLTYQIISGNTNNTFFKQFDINGLR